MSEPDIRIESFSDRLLYTTAALEQRVRVLLDIGMIHGYIMDIDQGTVLMYAQFRVTEAEVAWTVTLVPRTLVMIFDRFQLDQEPKEVRDGYRYMVGDRFATIREAAEYNQTQKAEDQS